jgi:hypothetical protein
MPPKKVKAKNNSRTSEDDLRPCELDIQYNPDIIENLLTDLKTQVDASCNQIQKDSDFMITSMQQAFHLELIKLPSQVKKMTVKRFKEEFGNSIEAVARGAMGGPSTLNPVPSTNATTTSSKLVFQTPSHHHKSNLASFRNPKEGEIILSENGSPLGEFKTVVKAPKSNMSSIMPPTPANPGVYLRLKGEIIDIDSVDDNMTAETKQDAILQVQSIMTNMQEMMAKLTQKG